MVKALTLQNEIIHKTLEETKGYEVKTNGSAFLLAFSHYIDAINFCLRVQDQLMKAEWPKMLLNHPIAEEKKYLFFSFCSFYFIVIKLTLF